MGEPSDRRENACAYNFSARGRKFNNIFFLLWFYILYICRKFQKLCQPTATFSTLLKCDSDIFFLNYQATGSLRNDKQSDSITPWKASFMICPKERAYCSRAKFKINTVINIISARWQTKKIIQLTQL